MEETTKLCPFCGGVIQSTAKKCPHCGKWLEKKCPACGEWIKIDAKKCRFCGEWQGDYEKWKYEKETGIKLTPQQPASSAKEENIGGDDNKKDGAAIENTSCLLSLEILGLICLYTWYYDITIWKSVIAYFVLCFLLGVRYTRILLCIIISALWGVIIYGIFESTIAAIIAFAVAVAIHSPQFFKAKDDIV